jgi:hypothetical protein
MATNTETSGEAIEYEKFRKTIEDIIKFTNTIDEVYREKCFEVLLSHYLSNSAGMKNSSLMLEYTNNVSGAQDLPSELKVFLQQNSISEEMMNKFFLREKGEVRPIYKITEKKKSIAQIQIAMLTALENALATPKGAFEFSMNTVRRRCVDYNVYDGFDFMFNFKNRAGLFTSLDHEVVTLTPIGKTELANIINIISKQ